MQLHQRLPAGRHELATWRIVPCLVGQGAWNSGVRERRSDTNRGARNPRVFWTFPGYGVRLPPAQSGNVVSLLRRFQAGLDDAASRAGCRTTAYADVAACFPCMSATPGDPAMYASKIAKPQTKTAAGSTDRLRSRQHGFGDTTIWQRRRRTGLDPPGDDREGAALSDTATFESVPAESATEAATLAREEPGTRRELSPPLASSAVPRDVRHVIDQPGRPLDSAALGRFQASFGHDFSSRARAYG